MSDELDLDALKVKAEAATPGEWEVDTNQPFSREIVGIFAPDEQRYIAQFDLDYPPRNRGDAEFIAAANPATVLALIERVKAAEGCIAKVEALHAKHENTLHATPEWVCSHRNCVDDMGDQCAWPCATVRALTEGDEG